MDDNKNPDAALKAQLEKAKIGFALCASFCTFKQAIEQIKRLVKTGASVTPIFSFNAASIDTRFGKAEDIMREIEDICGNPAITTIEGAEPIGPKSMFDALVIAPCTGNTIAKLALGITDTPVVMAAKSHVRNQRPAVLGIATNDALANSAKNIGMLLNFKSYYFVPFGQDNSDEKPRSAVSDFSKIPEAVISAMKGVQLQPLIY